MLHNGLVVLISRRPSTNRLGLTCPVLPNRGEGPVGMASTYCGVVCALGVACIIARALDELAVTVAMLGDDVSVFILNGICGITDI